MGINVIRPVGKDHEYVTIFRFDSYEHLRTWQESDIRRQLLKKAESFRESEPTYHLESGLEYWFLPHDLPDAPPRWKMAVVTVLGVWPVSMLVPKVLAPLAAYVPSFSRALFIAIGIVILLTWVVMPVLVKLLNPWLHHRPYGRQSHEQT